MRQSGSSAPRASFPRSGRILHGRFRLGIGHGWLGLLVSSLVLLVDAGSLLPAESALPVGVARVDITPDYPVRLTGFGRRTTESEGVEQRIHAKAIAFDSDANGPAVLITVDNLGVSEAIRSELLRRLAGRSKLTHDRLAICSSHTHSAPMINGVAPNIFAADLPPDHQARINRYTRELTDNLERVIIAALADRRPAHLAWAIGKVGFARNYSRTQLSAPVDHDLPALRIVSPEGEMRAILVSYACHAETLSGNTIHGDWSGSAQLALEADHPGAVALVAIGCGGDQTPSQRGTPEMADAQGREIVDEVKRLLGGPWNPLRAPLVAATRRIDLLFDKLPTRAEWERRAASEAQEIAFHARKNLARLDRGKALPTALPYLVQVWSFGRDLAMVFLPGEVVVDYGLRLKEEFDRTRIWVNAYANDNPGYIPSGRVLAEGGYRGGGAMVYYDHPTRFAPGVEDRLIRVVRELIPKEFLAPPSTRRKSR